MRTLLLLFLCCSYFQIYSSNEDSLLIEEYTQKVYLLYESQTHLDSVMYFLHEIGVLAYKNQYWEKYLFSLLGGCSVSKTRGDFEGTKCYAIKSYKVGNLYLKKDHPYHVNILNNLANYYGDIGEGNKAISLSSEALKRLLKLPMNTNRFGDMVTGLFSLGVLHANIGEKQKAISYYSQIVSRSKDSLFASQIIPKTVGFAYHSIGIYHHSIKNFSKAAELFELNIDFILTYNEKNIYALIENHISLANAQRELSRWEQSAASLEKVRYYQVLHKEKHGYGAKEVNFHNVSAKYYMDRGMFNEAIRNCEAGLILSKKNNPSQIRNYQNAYILTTMGDIYLKKRVFTRAIESYQAAITQYASFNFKSQTIYDNPESNDFHTLNPYLLKNIISQTSTFYKLYKSSSQEIDLKAAWASTSLLIQLADRYRHQLDTQGSQLFISTELKPAYEQAIEIALELYEITKEETYLEEAFKTSEKSKAVLLSNALTNTNAKYTGGIPDSLMSQERELLANISFYKKQVFEEKNKTDGPNEALINQWERKLFELDREKDAFDKQLEKNYPLYYQHKNQTEKISLLEIQKELDSQTELIEYFAGDSTLYVFNLNKEGINYKRIEKPASLYKRILSFSQGLADVNNQAQNIAVFTKQSYFLNQELIGEKRASVNKYIIIPDGILGRLPFELLLPDSSANKNYTRLPYLFTSHEIQYTYSALLLYKDPLKRTYEQAKASWVGFAPSFEKGKRLVYNQEEVEAIKAKMNGISYSGQSADLKTFLAQAENYQIIHLATHGYADVENPPFSRLEFTYKDSLNDGILYAHELANQRLKAELVVLSACETGHGSIAKGEGIMSLAWSFRYAGVPSILMSLWKAESNVTKQLMSHFYTHLEAGKSKSESIRLAKLDYLDNPIPGKEHPKYWANFVLIGDGEPLSRNFSMWWVFATLSVLIFAILYQFQRNTRSKTKWA